MFKKVIKTKIINDRYKIKEVTLINPSSIVLPEYLSQGQTLHTELPISMSRKLQITEQVMFTFDDYIV